MTSPSLAYLDSYPAALDPRHDGAVLLVRTLDGQSFVVNQHVHPCAAHLLEEVLGEHDDRSVEVEARARVAVVTPVTPVPLEPTPAFDAPPWVCGSATEWRACDVHGAHERGLSPRETEILELVCQGLSNQEIAGTLYLSINSIKTYIRSCYRKVGVTSRTQAVRWGITHGLGAARRPGA